MKLVKISAAVEELAKCMAYEARAEWREGKNNGTSKL